MSPISSCLRRAFVRLCDPAFEFGKPVEFAPKSVPEYGTLEEPAKEENGSIDTHDGISIRAWGKGKGGNLISWYVYRMREGRP